jgi:hypothetical protein
MKPRWIIICVVVVVVAFLPIGLKLWINAAEPRRWKAMEEQLAVLAREARARETSRPVLRGTPVPGNAWDDYDTQLVLINPPTSVNPCWEYLREGSKVDRAKVDALLTLYAPALQALRRGVVRSSADRRAPWEQGSRYFPTMPVIGLALCRGRFLTEAGQFREGAEHLLDAGQFCLDLARNGDIVDAAVGLNVLGMVHKELRTMLASPVVSRDDLLRIERELEVLEQNFPDMAVNHVNDSMRLGYLFLASGSVQEVMTHFGFTKLSLPTWRYGGSERIMMASAFEEFLASNRRLAAVQSKPWAEALQVQQREDRELKKSGNPLARQLCAPIGLASDSQPRNFVRESLAHHRMMRTALRFRATGEILPLDDPLGGKLLTLREGDRLKIWSVGGNGVDDGGIGEWKPGKSNDIVLEVERK